jgi:hypothetical protein
MSVGIATGYGLDGRGVGVRVPVGSRFFSPPLPPDRFWGPSSLLSNGYGGLFPGVMRPERKADHSPLSCTYVKDMWNYTATPPLHPHCICCSCNCICIVVISCSVFFIVGVALCAVFCLSVMCFLCDMCYRSRGPGFDSRPYQIF